MLVKQSFVHRCWQNLKHTSEEHGLTPGVTFGRGNLVIYVAKYCFGDFIQSLGTILQKKLIENELI